MSDIEDLADIVDEPPPDRSHLNLRQSAGGLKGNRKSVAKRAENARGKHYEWATRAPVTLPRLKFLEGDSK